METGLTRNQIFTELARSSHGKLSDYLPVVKQAFKSEAEFAAHLVAWNQANGQVRDAKVALPVISLATAGLDEELKENSLAHFALLGPREMLKGYRFALEMKPRPSMRGLRRVIEMKLRKWEADHRDWDKVALQHRSTLKELYALVHVKPDARANDILFNNKFPEDSSFAAVAKLKDMLPVDIAEAIDKFKIPFLIASGALGKKIKEEPVVLAIIKRMSATELVTNTTMLEKLGIKTNPVLRAAFEAGLEKVSKSKKNTLKTTAAAEAVEDPTLKAKLRGAQERQIAAMKGVEGNWLVLGDKSGSMSKAIELSRHVAGNLAKMVKGKVHLVFFDTAPHAMDVTGLALDEINKKTRLITANGGTSIGCGLQWALDKGLEIDGVAVISDGGENTAPHYASAHQAYEKKFGKSLPTYLYETDGEPNSFKRNMEIAKIDLQIFELRGSKLDYYSIPNLVATMRTNRYSLVDEVMEVRLLKLSDVFKTERKEAEAYA